MEEEGTSGGYKDPSCVSSCHSFRNSTAGLIPHTETVCLAVGGHRMLKWVSEIQPELIIIAIILLCTLIYWFIPSSGSPGMVSEQAHVTCKFPVSNPQT